MTVYTQPLPWADVRPGMTVELRHDKYPAVVGEVERAFNTDLESTAHIVLNAAWYWETRGWFLFVEPEPTEPDPLVMVIESAHRLSSFGKAAAVRAAGYSTEAEWLAESGWCVPLLDDAAELLSLKDEADWSTAERAFMRALPNTEGSKS